MNESLDAMLAQVGANLQDKDKGRPIEIAETEKGIEVVSSNNPSIYKDDLSEHEIINQYRTGRLNGVFITERFIYMPIRITGVGKTMRVFSTEDNDYVVLPEDRVKSNFFKPEIIEQCGRLPVLKDHPNGMIGIHDKKSLNHIIGQTIYAYIKGEEIWAIARIYDFDILKSINKDFFSTSPAVVSKCDIIADISYEKPIEINHIAFVERGHWDCVSNKAFDIDKITFKEDALIEELKVLNNEPTEELAENEVVASESVVEPTEPKLDDEGVVEPTEPKLDDEGVVEPTEPKLDDEGITEVTASEVEELDEESKLDDEGVENIDGEILFVDSSKLPETLDEEDENLIQGDVVTEDDKARDELIDELNEICDSAHASLKVKMPYIAKRETSLSVAQKFLGLNKHLLDSKYQGLVATRSDSLNKELCSDFIANIKQRINKSNIQAGKVATGFVPSKAGYMVDSDF